MQTPSREADGAPALAPASLSARTSLPCCPGSTLKLLLFTSLPRASIDQGLAGCLFLMLGTPLLCFCMTTAFGHSGLIRHLLKGPSTLSQFILLWIAFSAQLPWWSDESLLTCLLSVSLECNFHKAGTTCVPFSAGPSVPNTVPGT